MKLHYALFALFLACSSQPPVLAPPAPPAPPPSPTPESQPQPQPQPQGAIHPAPAPGDTATIFFAVLEGLYGEGVASDDVDLLLRRDPATNGFAYFVPGCPLCRRRSTRCSSIAFGRRSSG
ncbi:MAG TPA: hypothetical protein VF384_20340 [Planctomycetota bacterium]